MKNIIKLFCHKLKRNYEDYGIRHTIFKSLQSVIGIIYRKKVFRIYKKDMTEIADHRIDLSLGTYHFKKIETSDTDIIKSIENIAEWMQGCLKDMIDSGSYCFAFLEDGEIIAFNLVSFGEIYIPLIHYHKKFNTISAWSEHIWVNKNYRNKDVATQLRMMVFSELSKKGIRWLYGGCLVCNDISLKLARKLEFKNIADINYIRIFNFRKWKLERPND